MSRLTEHDQKEVQSLINTKKQIIKSGFLDRMANEERCLDMELMERLVNELNQYNREYYVEDNPTVSDAVYDKKYDELLSMERDLGETLPNSPTQRVGGGLLKGFNKITHKNPLWSLDKAQNEDELAKWCNDMVRFNKQGQYGDLEFVVSLKLDGLSMVSEYKEGILKSSATRGNGEIGEDITEQSKTIIDLPIQIDSNDVYNKGNVSVSVHGEVLLTKKAFEQYNSKNPKNPIKNLRNGASGSIRNLDLSECASRNLNVIFYDIKSDISDFTTYEGVLNHIKAMGFPTSEHVICRTLDEIKEEITRVENIRDDLNYAIDGLVTRVNNLDMCRDLGYTSKFPRFALAYKFEAEETTTYLRDVVWGTSRAGRINPVGIVDEVDIDGSTVGRVTLNNFDNIKKKGLMLNAEVVIRKSNDVIPEILNVVEYSLQNNDVRPIVAPTKCPSCSHELVTDGAYLRCENANGCKPQLVKAIQHYCQRDALNVDGFSEKTIEAFVDKGFIERITDIYTLNENRSQLIKLDGFGVKSIDKLLDSIEKSKDCKLHQLIFGLGISSIGLNTSKELAKEFANVGELINASRKDLSFIGDVASRKLYEWLQEDSNARMLSLLDNVLRVDSEQSEIIEDCYFSGKTIVITGSFERYKRTDIKDILEKLGAKIGSSVTKKTDLLVCGIKAGSKLTRANELGIEIIDENKFNEMIGDVE